MARRPVVPSSRAAAPDPLAAYRLTVRRGSKVSRRELGALDEAVEALREETEAVRAEGGLPEVTMIRTFDPSARVAARLEVSSGGWLRGRTAGLDVMGDGSVVAFRGGVMRQEVARGEDEQVYEAVRAAL